MAYEQYREKQLDKLAAHGVPEACAYGNTSDGVWIANKKATAAEYIEGEQILSVAPQDRPLPVDFIEEELRRSTIAERLPEEYNDGRYTIVALKNSDRGYITYVRKALLSGIPSNAIYYTSGRRNMVFIGLFDRYGRDMHIIRLVMPCRYEAGAEAAAD